MSAAALISIVDDDDSLRNSLNNLLRSLGYRTKSFSSTEEFVNSNHLHDTDCLILDVRMPGMSGLDLQHHLVEANSQVPIVFITSHGDDNDRDLRIGLNEVMLKIQSAHPWHPHIKNQAIRIVQVIRIDKLLGRRKTLG